MSMQSWNEQIRRWIIEPGCSASFTVPEPVALSVMIIFIASASANGSPSLTSALSSTK